MMYMINAAGGEFSVFKQKFNCRSSKRNLHLGGDFGFGTKLEAHSRRADGEVIIVVWRVRNPESLGMPYSDEDLAFWLHTGDQTDNVTEKSLLEILTINWVG